MKNSNFPKIIEIQFHNLCNANCLICPYKNMKYKTEYMNENLFYKFLNEIDDGKLTRIIPYLNNEPFIQKDYIDKVEKIRKKCPNTEIEISTNVSMLDEQKVEKLLPLNLTELRLSVFGYSNITYKKIMPCLNKEKVYRNLNIISEKFKESNTIISIVMIDNDEINENEFTEMKKLAEKLEFKFERWGFLDRSKNVCYKNNGIYNNNVCGCEQNRPLERMHILANGDVILCCQDWKHSMIIGNIEKNSIEEVWNSEKYNYLRNAIYKEKWDSPELCKNCKLAIVK